MWLVWCFSHTWFFPFRKFLWLAFFSKKVTGGDDGIRSQRGLRALVAVGSDSPPDCHSLPPLFESLDSSFKVRFWLIPLSHGGDDGIRTHDPLLAGQVLSQLSYTPIIGLFASPFFQDRERFYPFPVLCWHWAIFPGRFQPSIFATAELNFCVRNGYRWTLCVCNTNYLSIILWSLNIEQHYS